ARRALYEGAPERALENLRDPTLALSTRADALRQRAMDVLYRDAAHKASLGRDASVNRILGVAAAEDPARADQWRHSLAAADAAPERASGLTRLLAQMRDAGGGGSEAQGEPGPAPRARPVARAPTTPGKALRFQLAVDDGGEFLVVSGTRVTFGHARAQAADVPVLADIESVHALLEFGESFHGGPSWRIQALGRGAVDVNGRRIEGSSDVRDGDLVQLAANLAFRFRRPEPASTSALLEFLHGAESEGAQRVLLLAAGPSGRVRIGPKSSRCIPVSGIEHEVELTLEPAAGPLTLVVRCAGGVRVAGEDDPAERAATERHVPCPPERRVDVVLGARPSQRAPFGLSLSPIHPPSPTPLV
ncbi:MAG: FHA domain-containing protein, partial [Planctomycetota bacterium]